MKQAIAKRKCNYYARYYSIIYSFEQYWYTMPIAEPIMQYIKNKEIEEIVLGVELAETLELLHSQGISIEI